MTSNWKGRSGMRAKMTKNVWLAGLLLAIASEALFLLHLARPHKLVFDEVHYVPAARALLALSGAVNVEHPLLGKELIAAGIALFGDDSFGWRFFSALAGTATVLAVFMIVWLMLGRLRPAVMAALVTLLDFMVYVQARIAMLDGFMAAFLLLGIAALLWSMRARRNAWPGWLLGSVLLGLATACKWNAGPWVAFAALAFIAVRLRDADLNLAAALSGKDQRHWRGLPAVPAVLALGVASVATYALTYLPAFFYHRDPLTLGGFIDFQREMYAAQTQVLPHHTYQSNWWSWPLLVRPIWYLYERVDGAQRGILMIGNPAVMWGGLVAVLACLWAGFRGRSPHALAAAGLWIASYAMWSVIPKSLGFFYYYHVPAIFLSVAIAVAFDHWRARLRYWDESFVVLALALAIYFWPILSGAALSGPGAFHHWMWFGSWI